VSIIAFRLLFYAFEIERETNLLSHFYGRVGLKEKTSRFARKIKKLTVACSPTVCFTDLDKLNLPMEVRF
jgi:hypothetical protein